MKLRRVISSLVVVAALSLSGCGAPPAPGRAQGEDCNAAIDDACTAGLFCYRGEVQRGAIERRYTWGFPGARKSVPVGTCEPLSSAGAGCTANRRCIRGTVCQFVGATFTGICR
ncbi:MAG: hypothetical protein Q8Q09_06525 [Deltaproteobacteria bacterium]|nr:hypothetical protein [Deltaproteobacteria bacterium]